MNANHLADKFTAIGARLKVQLTEPRRWQADDYAIDIRRDREGEFFELRVPQSMRDTLDLTVLQADKRERHLLLLVRRPDAELDRFLTFLD